MSKEREAIDWVLGARKKCEECDEKALLLSRLARLEEALKTEAENERKFWIEKFRYWIKCRELGCSADHIRAQGFKDCVNAMEQNDRWHPAERAREALEEK